MEIQIAIPKIQTVAVPFDFPMFRTRLEGEYGISGFKKEYWKFESKHKVTKITEEMSQTTILTYNDPNSDFILEMMNENMLHGRMEYDIIPENIYDHCMQRLINKIFHS